MLSRCGDGTESHVASERKPRPGQDSANDRAYFRLAKARRFTLRNRRASTLSDAIPVRFQAATATRAFSRPAKRGFAPLSARTLFVNALYITRDGENQREPIAAFRHGYPDRAGRA